MARIISIVNQKGGTGKSACTANLAVGLAQKNMKVLIVDADPQSDVSAGFGYRDCDDSNEMNTTVISGRLVRNPGYNEVENEKGLHKIAKFVLAVRRNYSDEVSFIPVKAFAKKAEFARDYLMQGTKVMVEGEIVTGNYEDKDTGKKIYTTEVYANRIEFAGAKMADRPPLPEDAEGFLEIPEGMEEEMPFR